MGAKKHKNAVWVHQYFLFSFICEEGRQTIQDTDEKCTFSRPGVLDHEYGFTFEHFVQHILEANEYEGGVPSSRRRCIWQWKGALVAEVFADDDTDYSNDVDPEVSKEGTNSSNSDEES